MRALILALGLMLTTAAHAADRVVVIGGHLVELVYALGAGGSVVAVDDATAYDAAAKVPRVGSSRSISAEAVLAQRPTLILATDHAGPPGALDQLRAAGVAVEVLPGVDSVEAAYTRIRHLGDRLGVRPAADATVARMQKELAAIDRKGITSRVAFVYARGAGTLLVSGTDTGPAAVISLAGATPAVTAYSGFQPLTAESLVAAKPDVLVMTTTGLQSVGGIDGLLAVPGVSATPAGAARRVLVLDDVVLLGMGPRLPQAVATLNAALRGLVR